MDQIGAGTVDWLELRMRFMLQGSSWSPGGRPSEMDTARPVGVRRRRRRRRRSKRAPIGAAEAEDSSEPETD